MFKGLYTALITPFKYGEFDEEAFTKLVEWQIESGVHGLVCCGSTGEAQTLTREEQYKVIKTCVETTKGRIPVIAGTGSNSTKESIEKSLEAKELGVDGIMIVAPYYNKPVQEGIYQHYKAINDQVEIPMIIYNNPGRSAIDINDETIIRLSKLENIIMLKDSTGNLSRLSNILEEADPNFSMICGDDPVALASNAQGCVGCFSVTANVVPSLSAKIQNYWFKGEWEEAFKIYRMLQPLYKAIFCTETNPVPVKYAASLAGICSPDVRLPLVPLSDRSKKIVKDAMTNLEQKIKEYERHQEHCSTKS